MTKALQAQLNVSTIRFLIHDLDKPMMMIDYVYFAAVFVCAVSGAIVAARMQLDWVGAAALSLATALGGGTFRDIILDRTVFWIAEPINIWVSIAATCFTIIYLKYFKPPHKSLRLFDAIGLAFFTILGAEIASQYHDSTIIIVLMALFTGVLGGVIRDVLSNEVPYIFRPTETLYSVSALVGVVLFLTLSKFPMNEFVINTIAISAIIIIRLASIYFNLRLPSLRINGE